MKFELVFIFIHDVVHWKHVSLNKCACIPVAFRTIPKLCSCTLKSNPHEVSYFMDRIITFPIFHFQSEKSGAAATALRSPWCALLVTMKQGPAYRWKASVLSVYTTFVSVCTHGCKLMVSCGTEQLGKLSSQRLGHNLGLDIS